MSPQVSVECDLLFGLEDFFCLPPEFQSVVIDYNQQVQMGGMDPAELNMQQLVDEYIRSLTQASPAYTHCVCVQM